jgi:hypothetical protein
MKTLLENYTELNNSFKKELIYHLGVDSGFFSEYNNMILAMLYCLENKIKFTIYSKDANFRYNNGWTDYFLPFCEEQDNDFYGRRYNPRNSDFKKKFNPRILIHHLLNRNIFLTFELWHSFRNRNRETKKFYIPELEINGNLQEACQVLINLTWRYNETTETRINQLKSSLQLPEKYIGFHIRSGDKVLETKLLNISQYIKAAEARSDIKTAFVSTDNYSTIEEFQSQYNNWNIHTLSSDSETGYFHGEFIKRDKILIRKHYENFFASIDVLKKSAIFVGTFSSNIGMYLGMCMPNDKISSLDIKRWQIL